MHYNALNHWSKFQTNLTTFQWNFFCVLNWKPGFRFCWIFPQLFYCQDRKLLRQFSAQAIYLLDKTNRWKLKFWPSRLLEENSLIFFLCAELKARVQILLKLSTTLYSQDRKLMCPLSSQAISLLGKTNWWNLKFWPSRQCEETLLFFGRLNWKPGFRFSWNFPQPFTVRTTNCCVSFLLSQFIL